MKINKRLGFPTQVDFTCGPYNLRAISHNSAQYDNMARNSAYLHATSQILRALELYQVISTVNSVVIIERLTEHNINILVEN